jgi:ketosteroid isomerase-like protein
MSQQLSTIRQQIDSNNAAFMAAFRRGDSAGMAAAYTEDGEILPPNLPSMQGKGAIQAFWQGALDMGVATAALETMELQEMGDMAWEVGRGVLKAKDGQVLDDAKYIVIWQRENGRWKWHRDIWNSSRATG